MPSFSNAFGTGELSGVLTATQNPTRECSWVRFLGKGDNAGNVWIGGPGVTVGDEATDATTGIPLAAGDWSPWIAVSNLDQTYRICDNIGDSCYYMVS
jgi:hypothetical protein